MSCPLRGVLSVASALPPSTEVAPGSLGLCVTLPSLHKLPLPSPPTLALGVACLLSSSSSPWSWASG